MTTHQATAEQQLRALADRAAIAAIEVRYAKVQDDHDWDGFADLLDEHVEVVMDGFGAPVGRASFAEMARTAMERIPGVRSRHLVVNQEIELDGDRAVSATYGVAFLEGDVDGAHLRGTLVGRYRKHLRRGPAGWVVARVEMIDTTPADDAAATLLVALKGG